MQQGSVKSAHNFAFVIMIRSAQVASPMVSERQMDHVGSVRLLVFVRMKYIVQAVLWVPHLTLLPMYAPKYAEMEWC